MMLLNFFLVHLRICIYVVYTCNKKVKFTRESIHFIILYGIRTIHENKTVCCKITSVNAIAAIAQIDMS